MIIFRNNNPPMEEHYPHDINIQDLLHAGSVSCVLNAVTDGFYFVNNEWDVIFWNDAAESILNYPRKNILGKNLWDVFAPARDMIFFTEYHKAKAQNTAVAFEAYYPPSDIWVMVKAYPAKDGIAVYFKDITLKKKMQDEVVYQRIQQQAIINATEDVIWSIDRDYRLLLANDKFLLNVYRYSGKNLQTGDNVLTLMSEEEGLKWKPLYDKALAGQSFKHDMLISYSLTGESVYTEISLNPIYDESSCAQGIACYSRDITASKRYLGLIEDKNRKLQAQEQHLLTLKQELEMILDNSPDIIATLNKEGTYVSVNNTVLDILGYTPAEITGKHFSELVHPEDAGTTFEINEKIHGGTRITAFRNRLIKKNEAAVPLIWSAVWNKEAGLMFCVARDATILHAAELEKQKTQEKLEQAVRSLTEQNKVLKEIAFIQSHEVRRPVANILGLIQLMPDELSTQSAHCIALLRKSVEELDTLIRQIVHKTYNVREAGEAITANE